MNERRWWEKPLGIVALGVVVTVFGGLAVWIISRHYDKPMQSTAIEEPKVAQPQLQPTMPESKPQENTQPRLAFQGGNAKKPKIEQRGEGNGAVGGNIQQGPCSVIQVGGTGNQGSTNCALAAPSIQSVLLEARWLCDVLPEAERPLQSDRTFSMMSTTALLQEGGQSKLSLTVQSPIHQQENNGRLEVIEHFVALPESGVIGQPVESLLGIDRIKAEVLWITFADCVQPVSRESLAVSVNGTEVWKTSEFSISKKDSGIFQVSSPVAEWPTKNELIKRLSQ